ncbi:MAG: hypothetical protein AAF682_08905 [Planctomycetota bacterium]
MQIIKRDNVRLEAAPPAAAAARAGEGEARCAPQTDARLLRVDGVVRAIEVTCSCGEVTVLELAVQLDADADAAPGGSQPTNEDAQ